MTQIKRLRHSQPRNGAELRRFSDPGAEESVLSAMLVGESEAIAQVREIAAESAFERLSNRLVFRAIVQLSDEGSAIDPITVTAQLEKSGDLDAIGGKDRLTHLIDVVPTTANVRYHARLVRDAAARRHARDLAQHAITELGTPGGDAATALQALRDFSLDDTASAHELPRAISALEADDVASAEELVKDLFLRREPAIVAGRGGVHKSSFLLEVACAVACGDKACGRFEAQQGSVLIVSEEDSAAVIRSHILAICRGSRRDEKLVMSNIYILANAGIQLEDERSLTHLRREVKRLQAVFVILDPLAELSRNDENSPSEMKAALRAARSLAQPTGASVVIVHHATKAAEGKTLLDRIRGAGSIVDQSRLAYFVEKPDEPADAPFTVSCVKNSRALKVAPFVVKATIESNPDNRSEWVKARFEAESVRDAALDHACRFVLSTLRDAAERQTTTDLKAAAVDANKSKRGAKISGADIGLALKHLSEGRGLIDYEEGDNNKKLWGIRSLPTEARQAGQAPQQTDLGLPGNHNACPATSSDHASACLPFRGQAGRLSASEAQAMTAEVFRAQREAL